MAEAPPPTGPKKPDIQAGPGRGQVAGRGMPAAPLSSAPAGLSGPVRGVGGRRFGASQPLCRGPAAIQMQPKAPAALGGAPRLGLGDRRGVEAVDGMGSLRSMDWWHMAVDEVGWRQAFQGFSQLGWESWVRFRERPRNACWVWSWDVAIA